jgi:hypothetical protein
MEPARADTEENQEDLARNRLDASPIIQGNSPNGTGLADAFDAISSDTSGLARHIRADGSWIRMTMGLKMHLPCSRGF